ncbi:MAG: hypothetical protein LBT32_06860 [Peptococcaceae bacterium]|nr:hypothetical protein [Peptococcaceae bacterium]
MSLSTKELLYLEDVARLFESTGKVCTQVAQVSQDPQGKQIAQSIQQDYQPWISGISSIVNSNGIMQ